MEHSELSVREAAKLLGTNLHYTYELIWLGKIKARKNGRNWVVPSTEVHSFSGTRMEAGK